MIVIPSNQRISLYGPKMINMVAEAVFSDEYGQLGQLREYMLEMMSRNNGIGLAAPQIGVSKQFFVMEMDGGELIDLVNPEIREMYGIARTEFEACLSIPPSGNGCPVERCDYVEMEFSTSASEERQTRKFSFMDSRVAQHEFDHLTGTFFVDRVHPVWRKKVLDLFYKWKGKQECSAPLPNMPRSLPPRLSATPAPVS